MLASAKFVAAGLAVLALGGTSLGISNVFSSLISSFSRNPSLKGQLFSYAILGFALVEAMGLFALMMAFLFIYS